jgi:hopanoid biosynthesis associated RND transporter like protein HpnN
LTLVVVRFPTAVLAAAFVAAAVSIWLTVTQLGFHTSRAELMDSRSEYNRRWLDYTNEFGDKEDVVVVVEGEGREQTQPAINDVCLALSQQSHLFAAVLHELDSPKLRQKGLYFLKTEDLQKIDGALSQAAPILQGDWAQLNLGTLRRWMGVAMADGSEAQRQQILATVQNELPRMMQGLQAAFTQDGKYESPWNGITFSTSMDDEPTSGQLLSDDGRMGFVLLKLRQEDKQGFAQNEESITALRRLVADVKAKHTGVKIGLTGLPIIEYDEMKSSNQSMTAATILSFLGVFAVIVLAFGGLRHSLFAMTALVLGMIWACGCITLMIGYVSILSIAFASILFGLGIDYGIYYVSRYLQLRQTVESPSDALVAVAGSAGPGITSGAVTSAIAFLAAGFTDFPGVAQLGFVAGGGIMLCWLAEMTVLPAFIRLFDVEGVRWNLPTPLNLRFWLHPLFANPRLVLAMTVAGTLVLAVGVHYVRYDYNLLHMQPKGLESVELEHKLMNQTNRSAWFALSIGSSVEEVAKKKNAFLKLPSVERVEEVATKIPTDIAQKQPIIAQIQQRLVHLPQRVPQIAFTPQIELDQMLAGLAQLLASRADAAQTVGGLQQLRSLLQNMPADEYQQRMTEYQQSMATDLLTRLQLLKSVSSPEPPQLSDLPEGVLARSVGKTGRYLMRVYSKRDIWDVAANREFVQQVRTVDPEATGNPLQVYEASTQIKRSFEKAAWYALLAVVPVVLFDFRRLGHSLLAGLPMAVGLLQTFGLMGLLDIPLNPANIIVLPLVLGLGMESGINLIHDMRNKGRGYRGPGNNVIVAILVNSLTTMVGFGALMIANHQGLQSLGRVLTLAMGCCLFNAIVLPNLLVLGRFANDGNATDGNEKEALECEDNAEFDDRWRDEEEPRRFDDYSEDDYAAHAA